jgi:hypothetical protein
MTAGGSIAEEVATLEEENERMRDALNDLVADMRASFQTHGPHDGSAVCWRCQADLLAEEFSL